MVTIPDFALSAADLKKTSNKILKGLHFNLTEGVFLSQAQSPCYSLKELLIKSHLHLIKPSFIAEEFNAQLDSFIKLMGQLPDFIDGHQHVQQLPVIRKIILAAYKKRLQQGGAFIRSTYPAITLPLFHFKAAILAITGGKAFQSLLQQSNIPHNSCFAGVYNFDPQVEYRTLFRQWLATVPINGLIMCHPGRGDSITDPIAKARINEMNYFSSDAFVQDCKEYKRIV